MINRLRQFASIIIPMLMIVTWGFLLFDMMRDGQHVNTLIRRGDDVAETDPQQALEYYDEALAAGANPADLTDRYFTIHRDQATNPTAQNIYLLAEVERDGWTTESRRAYTNFLGNTLAIEYFLNETQDLNSADIAGLWTLLEEDVHQRDWVSARDHVQQILTLNPEDSHANYILGLILAIEDPSVASDYLDVAALDPNYSFVAGQARQLIQVKQSDETVTALTYFQSLGETLVNAHEWGLAEYAFSKALNLDGLDWFSYMYRGYVRDQLDEDGLSDLETAVALAPNFALPYYFLGLHWRPLERWDLAHEAFGKAYLLEPKNPALAVEIAQTYQAEGTYEEASSWYQIALSFDETNPEWYAVQSIFYAETGYAIEEEGLSFVETAYTKFPDNPEIVTSLGRIYHLLERVDEAEYHLNRAVSLDSNNPRARYYYGLLLEAQGDTGGARFAYQDVIRMVGDQTGYGLLASRKLEQLP